MNAKSTKLFGLAAAFVAALGSGCGNMAQQGRAPVQVVVDSLLSIQGYDLEGTARTPLISDVRTFGSYFNDLGVVTMRLVLKDLGIPGVPSAPSALNSVTITRYHVEYVRADGRNVQGVDVPYAFDSEVTFTIPVEGTVEFPFDMVRHSAKREAPLQALTSNGLAINVIGRVTFYGHDQAGNAVSVQASMPITFADFGDPED